MEENRIKPPEERLPIDEAIAELDRQIALSQERVAWLRKHRETLKPLPKPNFCGSVVDFDNLPHAEIVKVIRTIGGKWRKEPATDNALHYNSEKEIDGFKVRCYNGAPPPSCKIIEVEEHVPEQVIPATTRKVRKLVCLPEVGAVIAVAREKGLAEPPASLVVKGDPSDLGADVAAGLIKESDIPF